MKEQPDLVLMQHDAIAGTGHGVLLNRKGFILPERWKDFLG
jgi:hypothetical protein